MGIEVLLQKIHNIGVDPQMSGEQTRRVRTTNNLLLLGLLFTPVFMTIFLIKSMHWLTLLMSIHWLVQFLAFYLLSKKNQLAATTLSLVWSSLFVFACAYLMVGDVGAEYVLISLMGIPVLTIGPKKIQWMFAVCGFLTAVAVTFIFSGVAEKGIYHLQPQIVLLMKVCTLGILVSMIFGQLIFFYIETEKNKKAFFRQQKQLMLNSKLSDIGMMAAGMAHEINNPLTTILICTNRIIQEGDGSLKKYADNISICSHRIKNIVRGLSHASRDSSSDPFTQFKMNEIIDDVVAVCSARLSKDQIKLEIDSQSLEFSIIGQKGSLEQVFINLIANAIDAISGQEGKKWIQIRGQKFEDFIEISVTDSGDGIPESVAEKIMSPFYTTKEIGKGTGLGLSISRGIIERHDGDLRVCHECKNTRMVIRLPVTQTVTVGEKREVLV